MSTFGALNTAYLGLTAAQHGINLAGQNIANATTAGYTRQRLEQSAVGSPARTGLNAPGVQPGQGVSVDGVTRLGSSFLDAGVRTTAAQLGYSGYRSAELQRVEGTLQEPGPYSISTSLQGFWASWQGVSNHPGEAAPAGVLLQSANELAGRITDGYKALDAQWSRVRGEAAGTVAVVNDAAARIASFNTTIRSVLASGGSANELIDARNQLTETIASLAGGTVREANDGTVDVLIGGNALVSGTAHRELTLAGQPAMGAAGAAVQLEWADRPGAAVGVDGGRLAGALSVLAPAGAIASAANSYNDFAGELMTAVNTVYRSGQPAATAVDFFSAGSGPLALSLSVVPTDVSGIAVGTGSQGGGIADQIAQIGTRPGSPDSNWTGIVTGIGSASRSAQQHELLAEAASSSAALQRASGASVSLDEENISLLTSQHAYQAAARVMTAVDEALDVLINRTGLVGR